MDSITKDHMPVPDETHTIDSITKDHMPVPDETHTMDSITKDHMPVPDETHTMDSITKDHMPVPDETHTIDSITKDHMPVPDETHTMDSITKDHMPVPDETHTMDSITKDHMPVPDETHTIDSITKDHMPVPDETHTMDSITKDHMPVPDETHTMDSITKDHMPVPDETHTVDSITKDLIQPDTRFFTAAETPSVTDLRFQMTSDSEMDVDECDDSVRDPDYELEKECGSSSSDDEEDMDTAPGSSNNVSSADEEDRDGEITASQSFDGDRQGLANSGSSTAAIQTERETEDWWKEKPSSRKPANQIRGEIDSCVRYSKIYTRKYKKDNERSKHNRSYDTVHCCLFCEELFTNIQTHLKNKHAKEDSVKEITTMKRRAELLDNESKKEMLREVKKKQNLLRNKGDNRHNMKVCSSKEGELILARRRKGVFDSRKYGSCPECAEWMVLKDNYNKHMPVCPGRSTTSLSTAVLQNMVFKGVIKGNASNELKEVIKSMQKDNIALTAVEDKLICALGEAYFLSTYSNKLKRKNYASFRMRLAARLLILVRGEIQKEDVSMSECLIVENFDIFVKCALLACEKTNENELKHPSVAIKIGQDMEKMLGAKIAYAVKSRNEVEIKESKMFEELLKNEWTLKVKKQATLLLQERQFNKASELPHPEDIAMLAQYLIGKLKTLKLEKTITSYRQVVLTTEARLLLYNRRRPGELEALDIPTYKKRSTSVNETDLSLRQELTKLEKNLLHSQELVEMRGKSNNKIPLLLPEEVRKPLAYLVDPDVREAVGVKKDNQYVFASTGNEPVRAGTALDVMKYESNLRFPERILATNLRKHTATISQVMGLKDHELKWLLKHLGHTEKVHLAHYRATSGIIERLDIAKLMLMQEKNVVSRYAGVELGDITFEELDDEGEGDAGGGGDTGDGGDEGDEGGGCDKVPEELNEEGMTRKQKKKSTREKWTEEEMQEIDEHFGEYLAMRAEKRGPGQKECLKAISLSRAKGGALCRRHWETIKKKVFNMVNKKKRDM